VTRLDDVEKIVNLDRCRLDIAFNKVSGRYRDSPPRLLTEAELNDEKMVEFIAKYESSGERSSWGDETLEWINSIPEWDDRRLRDEVEANQEGWQRDHIGVWGYDH